MKKFAVTPPCSRPQLAPGQIADPTSLKRGEDYPEEWAKRQAQLARQAREAVRIECEFLHVLGSNIPVLPPLSCPSPLYHLYAHLALIFVLLAKLGLVRSAIILVYVSGISKAVLTSCLFPPFCGFFPSAIFSDEEFE